MYLMRLFRQDDPSRQIDARSVDDGEIVVGREPGAGWRLDDPARQISRAHCTFAFRGGEVAVRDTSSNGVFRAATGDRLPSNQFAPLSLGEALSVGDYLIVVELVDQPIGHEPEPPQPPQAASPFAPPPGLGLSGVSAPLTPDPFASALRPSPLDAPGPARGLDLGLSSAFQDRPTVRSSAGEDVWEQPRPARAGDWNARSNPGAPRGIGAERDWSEPPAAGPSDLGFGFDAPFNRPILEPAPISREALQIPSNWDQREAQPSVPEMADKRSFTPSRAPMSEAPVESPEALRTARPAEPAHDLDERPHGAAPAAEPHAQTPPQVSALSSPPLASPPAATPEPQPPSSVSSDRPDPARDFSVKAPTFAEPSAALAAFCDGANLDVQEFANEPPLEVLRQAGAMYQQMVLGLYDLLGERTSLKNEYRMVRTTVAPDNNNPFKWAPARRVATDLLRTSNDGFLHGSPAVRESFEDIKKHLLCLLAGLRAALSSTIEALSPSLVEERLRGQSFVLKAHRSAASWTEYQAIHAAFRKEADDNPDSQVNRDFRAAYERQLRELDGLDTAK